MSQVKSRIYIAESVDNTNPRGPNADAHYAIAYIEFPDGTLKAALFTDADLQKAMKRAEKNPEDLNPAYAEPEVVEPVVEKTWWDKILGR